MPHSITEDFIPVGRRNRPGLAMTPKYITIHDTANPDSDASNHASYVKGDLAANAPVSWHFTVDDKEIIQHLPLNEVGWHAGDGSNGPGNRQSIGIEICEFTDNNRRAKAEGNAVWLVAKLLDELQLPISAVVQHNHWTGKNCPRVIRGRQGGWDLFLRGVQVQLDVLAKEKQQEQPPPVPAGTPIIGAPQATVQQAQAWALSRGAHLRFIEIAPVYWEYGDWFGIRPEVLYAQAAKETAFGKYTGAVKPEQNNWAGIKTSVATGDRPEDHETFSTPSNGVRAHFNHICAYVGKEPLKPVHARYGVVMSLGWAGTIRTVEELGARWAPNSDYGNSIVRDYLLPLMATQVPSQPAPEPPATDYKALYEQEKARADAAEDKLKRVKEYVASL